MKDYKFTLEDNKEDLVKAIKNLQVRLRESYKREDNLRITVEELEEEIEDLQESIAAERAGDDW